MKDFKSNLGDYKVVPTDDGTLTLYSSLYDENCHSTSGAMKETIHNYVNGCEILNRAKGPQAFNILEIGHGLGLGFLATYKECEAHDTSITFISTEIDKGLVEWAIENVYPKEWKELFKFNTINGLNYFSLKVVKINYLILIGDARQTITLGYKDKLFSAVSAIYQDAFSPKKNPTLWTLEWFNSLREVSKSDVILTTYSASTSIRKSLVMAKWHIKGSPGFGNKRSMTKAFLCPEKGCSELTGQMRRSKLPPLQDS